MGSNKNAKNMASNSGSNETVAMNNTQQEQVVTDSIKENSRDINEDIKDMISKIARFNNYGHGFPKKPYDSIYVDKIGGFPKDGLFKGRDALGTDISKSPTEKFYIMQGYDTISVGYNIPNGNVSVSFGITKDKLTPEKITVSRDIGSGKTTYDHELRRGEDGKWKVYRSVGSRGYTAKNDTIHEHYVKTGSFSPGVKIKPPTDAQLERIGKSVLTQMVKKYNL